MTKGKRAGTRRRAARRRTLPSRASLLHSLGITLCVVAWGFLVKAAIDFGIAGRDGERAAWAFLALACVGAAACLFTGLIIGTRLLRALGIIAGADHDTEPAATGSVADTAGAADTPATANSTPHAAAEPGTLRDATPPPTYSAPTDPPPGPYRGRRIAR